MHFFNFHSELKYKEEKEVTGKFFDEASCRTCRTSNLVEKVVQAKELVGELFLEEVELKVDICNEFLRLLSERKS